MSYRTQTHSTTQHCAISSPARQPTITELPGLSELAADRVWETDTGATVLRLHPEPQPTAR